MGRVLRFFIRQVSFQRSFQRCYQRHPSSGFTTESAAAASARRSPRMCGIVGYIGSTKVVPVIIEGLRKLEYRGYDSAGIAVVTKEGKLEIRRAPGKLRNLEDVLAKAPIEGTYGIGHTRWATHGRPTEENAHPHRDCTGQIVVVHNGIIENYLELKEQLQAEGHKFVTETDTEIVAHLVEKNSQGGKLGLEEAVRQSLKQLRGIYSLVLLSAREPQKIVAARLGPPSVIGLGDGEYFVASDIPALLEHTRKIFFLADGDIAVLTPAGVKVMDHDGRPVERPAQHVAWDPIMAEKGGYKHFMQKEIFGRALCATRCWAAFRRTPAKSFWTICRSRSNSSVSSSMCASLRAARAGTR